jgi:hypothetical protein
MIPGGAGVLSRAADLFDAHSTLGLLAPRILIDPERGLIL